MSDVAVTVVGASIALAVKPSTAVTAVAGQQGPPGPIGGTDKQVLFNDGGNAAGGSSLLTFDKTTGTLTVGPGGSVAGVTRAMVGLGNVDNTSDANKPVSTAVQAALNAKQATLVSGTNIKTINGTSLLSAGNVDTGGAVNGLLKCNGSGAFSAAVAGVDYQAAGSYATTNGANATGTWPVSITGNADTVTNGVYTTGNYADPTWLTSLAKTKVGLGNVDNTSDVNKPVSTAQQAALNAKQDTLVSGTNIKKINGATLLGAGNVDTGGAVNGLLKCNGAGAFSAAVAGTDYVTPSGNVATVTNGVYTTGSYADPTWLTSLAKTKVGLGNVEDKSSATIRGELTAANVTTALGATAVQNATNATNATYLSGTQQQNPIHGAYAALVMAATPGAWGSFVCRANSATGDNNLAGMSFWHDSYGIKMGVRSDGYFGIGGWSRPAWSWYSDPAGNMVAAGNVTQYSDPRLKENFKRVANPMEILRQLDGGTFNWKSGIPHTSVKAGKRDYGILADQVEAVMPEIVTESIEIDGVRYKTVAYEKLVPVLIEAIKHLEARVSALEAA